jgi:flagellar protein FlbD
MIQATRLSGSPLLINALLIESIETTPDTVITLVTDRKIVVRESADELTQLVREYLTTIGGPAATAMTVKSAPDVAEGDGAATAAKTTGEPDPSDVRAL